jgi:predicted secreted protein
MKPMKPMTTRSKLIGRLTACVLAAASISSVALAADQAAPSGVVALTATASTDVTRDMLTITLMTNRDGADASAVQSSLKQAVESALSEARSVSRPGQIDVRTGNFSLSPRYSPKNAISGWQGSAEVVLEGRDLPGLSQLAGRIQSMSIARVSQGLSREQREKAEAAALSQAISRYRAQAAEVTKQFGYSSYVVREVSVSTNDPGSNPVPMFAVARSMAVQNDAPMPIEAGQTSVTVTVNGTVQMAK